MLDGEYSELIRLLASFHDTGIEKSLLPGLARAENLVSVGTALIMSAVDIARAASSPPDRAKLQQDIVARAADEYAVTSNASYVKKSAAQLANGLLSVRFAN